MRRTALLLLALSLPLAPAPGPARAAGRRDLDVEVPPGSPLDWGRAFPVTRPFRGRYLPRSRPGRSRTVQRPEPRALGADGMVRILTWDIAGHLPWVAPSAEGGALHEAPGLHWVCLAPFLRLLLHPGQVLEPELEVHLLELGEPVLAVLPAVRGERSLADLADDVERRLSAPRAEPLPFPVEGVRAAMLQRFAVEELLASPAYDPERDFGERLFYLAEEMLPVLAQYVGHPDARLRRGAVAALGRYRDGAATEVLERVGRTSPDPVVRVRALAALARSGSPRDGLELVQRLRDARDPVEVVLLAHTLGRLRTPEAAPVLVEVGRALEDDRPEVLASLLAALARGSYGAETEAVLDFAERARSVALGRPRALGPSRTPNVSPDVPDPPRARARMLAQLASCVLVRWSGNADGARLRFLEDHELAGKLGKPVEPVAMLRAVQPRARALFLSTLAGLGDDGLELLRAVADGAAIAPELRTLALAELPYDERVERIEAVLGAEPTTLELRLAVLEMLETDPSPRFEAPMRSLLAAWGREPPGRAPHAVRAEALRALRWLEDHGRLRFEDLEPLLVHLEAPHQARPDLVAELAARVREWVDALRGGTAVRELREHVRAAVARLVKEGYRPELGPREYEGLVQFALDQLDAVAARAGNEAFARMVEALVVERLTGLPSERPERAVGQFFPPIALEENLILALGRSKEQAAEAAAALHGLLQARRGRFRAVACLAAGLLRKRELVEDVVPFLLDPEPFCRLAAAEALAPFTELVADVDWMYGDSSERFDAAEEVRAWSLEAR